MKFSDFRVFLCGSLVVFFGGLSLQLSLFDALSRQQRNTTALNNISLNNVLLRPPPPPLSSPNIGRGKLLRLQQQLNGPPNYGRCAINLYGLPRAFESLVLPSLAENVIRVNAAYRCDYFVHYYNLTLEASGRSGAGGVLDPHEVRRLTQAVHQYDDGKRGQQRELVVEYAVDEEEYFWKRYHALLKRIHNKTDDKGRYIYYPWKARTYKYPITVDNIVKMWHSIEHAWKLMEAHEQRENIQYTRVAMLRSDVVYMTPIDIWETEKTGVRDRANNVAVIPGFGRHPVSDRIIYGPYEAVRQWSTTRFSSLDHHVQWILKNKPGWGMHSEKFVNFTVLPAIRGTGAQVADHETMCFFRARSDETVWINDCDGPPEVASRKIHERLNLDRRQAVETVLGRKCPGEVHKITRMFSALDCKRETVPAVENS